MNEQLACIENGECGAILFIAMLVYEGYYYVCLPYLMPCPTAPCHVFVKQCKPQKRQRFVQEGQGSFFFWGGCANKWRDFEGFALMSWFYFMTPKNLGYTHQSFTFRGPKMPPFQGNRFAYIVRRPKPGLIDQNLGDDIG